MQEGSHISNFLFHSIIQSLVNKTRVVSFIIFPQGASTPIFGAAPTRLGAKSVSRTSAGLYVITLANTYRALIDAQISLSDTTLGQSVNFAGVNVTGAGTGPRTCTVQCFTTSTGAAVDVAANANNYISVSLICKDAVS